MRRFAPGFELYSARTLLAKDFDGTLEALAKLGYREVEGSDLFGRTPAEAQRRFASLGLAAPAWHCFLDPENGAALDRFAYHNHHVELRALEPGTSGLELLLDETDPGRVSFEIDLCWTVAGGADPRALFARHPGRFSLCHAKDTNPLGEDLDVGEGIVDFAAILADAEHAGIEHVFVERDTEEDPLRTAARGYARLAPWWSAASR